MLNRANYLWKKSRKKKETSLHQVPEQKHQELCSKGTKKTAKQSNFSGKIHKDIAIFKGKSRKNRKKKGQLPSKSSSPQLFAFKAAASPTGEEWFFGCLAPILSKNKILDD